jgi:hypothetical protein
MDEQRFAIKISLSPSGLLKVSDGISVRKRLRDAVGSVSASLSLVNHSELQDLRTGFDFPHSDDCPRRPSLKVGWGLLGNKRTMSAKTSRSLREIMSAIEIEYGRERCLFITLTLPSDDSDSYEALARYSSYAVNRFSQWIRDNFGEGNIARAGVWEYQKRGAPHYHLLLAGDCMDAINIEEFRKDFAIAWMSTLEGIEELSGCPMFSEEGVERDKERLLRYEDLGQRFCNVQRVEKSVVAYLSFYLSESNHDKGKDKNGLRKRLFPFGSWAQWNRKARSLCSKYSIEFRASVWADNYDDWGAIKEALLTSIELADETKRLKRENDFWSSSIALVKEKGMGSISLVNGWIRMLKSSGILCQFSNVFRFIRKPESTDRFESEQSFHDLKLLSYQQAKMSEKIAVEIGKKMANNLDELLLKMLLCERELIEHKKFDYDLNNYHQQRLL